MSKIRKNYTASFKAKVALEALKKEKTISQLSSEYGVHSNQISQWRKRLLEELPDIFSQKRKKKEKRMGVGPQEYVDIIDNTFKICVK